MRRYATAVPALLSVAAFVLFGTPLARAEEDRACRGAPLLGPSPSRAVFPGKVGTFPTTLPRSTEEAEVGGQVSTPAPVQMPMTMTCTFNPGVDGAPAEMICREQPKDAPKS